MIQFLASPRFMQKLERAKALLSNKNGALSHESVLEAALDGFWKAHDPEERQKRREGRREKAEARTKAEERAATHHLQIDHVIPCARGGTNSIENLRLLCERHNKLEAERVLGTNTIRRFRRRE